MEEIRMSNDQKSAITRADTPEQIRQALDDDASREFLQSESGKWYTIEDGELKEVAA